MRDHRLLLVAVGASAREEYTSTSSRVPTTAWSMEPGGLAAKPLSVRYAGEAAGLVRVALPQILGEGAVVAKRARETDGAGAVPLRGDQAVRTAPLLHPVLERREQ